MLRLICCQSLRCPSYSNLICQQMESTGFKGNMYFSNKSMCLINKTLGTKDSFLDYVFNVYFLRTSLLQ